MASNGVVTPEAKSLFERANADDPEDVMAQYYLGLSAKQEGRREEALKRWTALVSTAREGAEWLPMVKNALARVDEKGPPVRAAAPSAAVTPPEHNGGAIEAMVERLAERLKKDGSDVPGWVQLALLSGWENRRSKRRSPMRVPRWQPIRKPCCAWTMAFKTSKPRRPIRAPSPPSAARSRRLNIMATPSRHGRASPNA